MSDSFGLGDGSTDLSNVRAVAEAKVADAQRQQPNPVDAGRWPRGVTVVRLLVALVVAIVLLGWLLTALNGGA
jgi:hypothetical protein